MDTPENSAQISENAAANRARRNANIVFGAGWVLTLMNLTSVGLAIWFHVDLVNRPQRFGPLFFIDEQVAWALTGLLLLAGYALFALLQILFLDSLAGRLKADIEETVAAEASIRLAKYAAYLALAACIISFILSIRTHRNWAEFLRNFT